MLTQTRKRRVLSQHKSVLLEQLQSHFSLIDSGFKLTKKFVYGRNTIMCIEAFSERSRFCGNNLSASE